MSKQLTEQWQQNNNYKLSVACLGRLGSRIPKAKIINLGFCVDPMRFTLQVSYNKYF